MPFLAATASVRSLAARALTLLLWSMPSYTPPAANAQNINIDWSSGAPRLTDFEDEHDDRPSQGASESSSSNYPSFAATADSYEEAWWAGGHGEDDQSTWFSASDSPRLKRPASIELRVGDTYTHVVTGSRGVIIGWDERLRAPRRWINQMDVWEGQPRGWSDRQHRLTQPWYSVLEVSPDGHQMQRYVSYRCRPSGHSLHAEPCLKREDSPKPLHHDSIDSHLIWHKTGGFYRPRELLKMKYIRDAER